MSVVGSFGRGLDRSAASQSRQAVLRAAAGSSGDEQASGARRGTTALLMRQARRTSKVLGGRRHGQTHTSIVDVCCGCRLPSVEEVGRGRGRGEGQQRERLIIRASSDGGDYPPVLSITCLLLARGLGWAAAGGGSCCCSLGAVRWGGEMVCWDSIVVVVISQQQWPGSNPPTRNTVRRDKDRPCRKLMLDDGDNDPGPWSSQQQQLTCW